MEGRGAFPSTPRQRRRPSSSHGLLDLPQAVQQKIPDADEPASRVLAQHVTGTVKNFICIYISRFLSGDAALMAGTPPDGSTDEKCGLRGFGVILEGGGD